MIPMMYAGIPKEEREEIARKIFKNGGLSDRIGTYFQSTFRRSTAKSCNCPSLVLNPAIILADEPTGNIATTQAEEVMAIFQKLNKEGHTIIMITHEPDIAEHAKRIIHIKDGKIVKDGNGHKQRVIKLKIKYGYREIIEEAVRTLTLNKLRTGLAMLGIIIGIGSVIALVSLARVLKQQFQIKLNPLVQIF